MQALLADTRVDVNVKTMVSKWNFCVNSFFCCLLVPQDGYTALMYAISQCNTAIVNVLLADARLDVNLTDKVSKPQPLVRSLTMCRKEILHCTGPHRTGSWTLRHCCVPRKKKMIVKKMICSNWVETPMFCFADSCAAGSVAALYCCHSTHLNSMFATYLSWEMNVAWQADVTVAVVFRGVLYL